MINIDKLALDILDSYITKRAKYGIIIGPTASGKSTLSKHIATSFGFELVEWEPTKALIKEKHNSNP